MLLWPATLVLVPLALLVLVLLVLLVLELRDCPALREVLTSSNCSTFAGGGAVLGALQPYCARHHGEG